MTTSSSPYCGTDTSTWHLPHSELDKCHRRHLRLDEVLLPPDPAPTHRLAWPTRPLLPDDPIAATREADAARGRYYCHRCRHRRGSRGGPWRTITQAQRHLLPTCGAKPWPGCSDCGRPWPRSAFAAAAYFRSPGQPAAGSGLLCPPCATTRPDGGWFQPTGRRLSPLGRAWYRLLSADDPLLFSGTPCALCGREFGDPAQVPTLPADPAPPNQRPVPRGRRRYERMPALNGLVPPWPYLAHPWDLRDALSVPAPVPPNLRTYRGLRQGGPLWRAWYLTCRDQALPAVYRAGGTPEGPYACQDCALDGRVPHAEPLPLRELVADRLRPPASGIACYGCARPVVPERWHHAHEDQAPRAVRGSCPGPHVRRDETLRPPGFLDQVSGARPTRALEAHDVIGGAAERGDHVQLLCLACYVRARRSPSPHWPLLAAHRPTLPGGCDRCHRPWPLSAPTPLI